MLLVPRLLITFFIVFFPQSEPERISWQESPKLTWNDFKGMPEPLADYVASTNSGISFSFSYSEKKGKIDMDYSVTCNFYPETSWYKKGEVSDYTLKHEQTHFDISELHARKLRKEISAAHFSKNIKKEIEALYHKIEKDRREMQTLFDKESNHSKNHDKENQWEVFVARQLKTYEPYK